MEQELSRRLLDFLDSSPSCYHAVDNLARRLEAEGYERLREAQPWTLQSGGKYYVVRGDSTLAAFRIPAGSPAGSFLYLRICHKGFRQQQFVRYYTSALPNYQTLLPVVRNGVIYIPFRYSHTVHLVQGT